MPGIIELYNEAIQFAQIRLKVPDPDLKQGSVEMVKMPSNVRNYQRPWYNNGSFAIVYKFRAKSGQLKAMRCFIVDPSTDTQQRYEKMSRFFASSVPAITANFKYYDAGIAIKKAGQVQLVTRPIIVMDWINGGRLLDKVRELCKLRDSASLLQLVEQWLDLLTSLRQAKMAHGDLTSENVMVRADGHLVLIDYDSVYIPGFSGLSSNIAGQEAYQHPQMNDRPFNEHMDDFSGYVIYIALLALHLRPQLWDTYSKYPENNLLFTRDDFLNPKQSQLFRELEQINHPDLKKAIHVLKQACTSPINRMQLPALESGAKEKDDLKKLEEAIRVNDDDKVVKCWTPALVAYPLAQPYKVRVEAAQKRLVVLSRFRAALQTRTIERIVVATVPELLGEKTPLSADEVACALLAKEFQMAYQKNDDDALATATANIESSTYKNGFVFTPKEKERIVLAQKYKSALGRFRLAWYRTKNAKQIVAAYDPFFDTYKSLPEDDKEVLEKAQRFLVMAEELRAALKANNGAGDDVQIFAAYNKALFESFTDFTVEEKERITLGFNREMLKHALRHNIYREVVRCARDIEIQTHESLKDELPYKAVSEARKRFLAQFQPKNLQVQVLQAANGNLRATWQWPVDILVQHAVMIWRTDRWPTHPGEQGTFLSQPIIHQSYELQKGFTFTVGSHEQIYVQVHLALQDGDTFKQGPIWLYSNGKEPTARCIVKLH